MFIRAMVRIFSFGERWNVPFNSAVASLNGTFHLSPHENILTIALINIHYLDANQTVYFVNHSPPFDYDLRVGDSSIPIATNIKILCVTLDKRLTFELHKNEMLEKVNAKEAAL
jgi:hypothetical protein